MNQLVNNSIKVTLIDIIAVIINCRKDNIIYICNNIVVNIG